MTSHNAEADPLADLRARIEDALAELHDFRCDDPAACDAIQAVKLTARTLEWFWIPALELVLADAELASRDRQLQRRSR